MAETTPPKPAFAPTRCLPLPGGAKLVFCSGVTARGSAAEAQRVEAQAEECFARLTRALAQEGGSFADVLKLNTYLSDMRDYAGFDAVRRRILAALPVPPASPETKKKHQNHQWRSRRKKTDVIPQSQG